MKKLIFGLSLLALTSVAFAETRDVKIETPAKSTTEAKSMIYFVTGQTSSGGHDYYTVTESDPDCPDTGSQPCEVISSLQKDNQNRIPTTAVTQVLSTRP
ncbi:hypothetical protein [Sphingobacterium sp.]|uniref:hypothetical protein n=1 Tax=Sphingobacterium sp. TaxID=341027 RepID=UPI0031DB9FC8